MPPIDWSQVGWPVLLALLLGGVVLIIFGTALRATWYKRGYSRGYERGVAQGGRNGFYLEPRGSHETNPFDRPLMGASRRGGEGDNEKKRERL